jgi:hypothetical protein
MNARAVSLDSTRRNRPAIRSVTCSNSGHHRRTTTLGPAAVTVIDVSTMLNDQVAAARRVPAQRAPCDHERMQLFGDRIVAPKALMIREIMVHGSCNLITVDRALFLRRGDTLWLDGTQPVVERLDGTTMRPPRTWCTVKWAHKLL